MDNLEQQLQQLRLIHKRITSNEPPPAMVAAATSANNSLSLTNPILKSGENVHLRKFSTNLTPTPTKTTPAATNYAYGQNLVNNDADTPHLRWDLMKKQTNKRRDDTLDNPIVLDQQLEALAHHKRQMEKRGLLQQKKTVDQNKMKLKAAETPTAGALLLLDATATAATTVSITPDLLDSNTSPPSPVSSSYSELRHATDSSLSADLHKSKMSNNNINANIVPSPSAGTYMNLHYGRLALPDSPPSVTQDSTDYYDFGNFSQTSSTYESIYEPINPRPSSQLSNTSRRLESSSSSLSFNPPYANLMHSAAGTLNSDLSIKTNVAQTNNYAARECGYETESLPEFFDRPIDINDCENYGNCCKCNERVLGENSGCTAMDQIYHIECFTCTQCQINLQGKPFYAIDNKAYCEFDYLQTLEKCSVCMTPILERILRATGKPYHPQCFTCVVCGKSLDGIPFTVDATNQNYCITDFHKKFAPRCCVCKEPIMPESGEEETVRVVALDRSFHLKCYKCEDCGLLLSSNSEGRGCYPLDDHVLCKSCNAKRVQFLTSNDL